MKYNIIAALTGLQYTFTGADDDAQAESASDETLTLKIVNGSSVIDNAKLSNASPFKIKRVRLRSSGAEGLTKPQGVFAGRLLLSFVGSDSTEKSASTLTISNWNEWEEKDISVSACDGDKCSIVLKTGSLVNIHDFNVQDEYVGQSFTPMLEMEVEYA